MRKIIAIVVPIVCLAACNFDAGECYVRGQEGAGNGVGGGVITPGGVGGYGDAPPSPQGDTDPPGDGVAPEVPKQPMLFDYGPLAFPFVVTIPDDGTDAGGGWQQATTKLFFSRKKPLTEADGCNPQPKTEVWTCPVTAGMPVRNYQTKTKISTTEAANKAADAATSAENEVKRTDGELEWKFCERFRTKMRELLKAKVAGARVTEKPQ